MASNNCGIQPISGARTSTSRASNVSLDIVTTAQMKRHSHSRSPARTSLCSAASLSSDETSDSGFYQLNPPDGLNTASVSPRFIPKEWRRSPNPSDMNPDGDIDFFLKMLNEFREYVTDKIDYLEGRQKQSEESLVKLQSNLKAVEDKWGKKELELSQDITAIISLLHKKQNWLVENIQRKRNQESTEYRKAIDTCRRNIKIINGVLAYSNRIKMETAETIRAHTVKELKHRLSLVNDLFVDEPDVVYDITNEQPGFKEIHYIKNILNSDQPETDGIEGLRTRDILPPVITAQQYRTDVRPTTITVRWYDPNNIIGCSSSYEVTWSFNYKGSTLERKAMDIEDTKYTIENLHPSCAVTVYVRGCYGRNDTSPYSMQATYKTLPAPQKFCFDSTTAHAKLKLSNSNNSVFYPGENYPKNPGSPGRFSFALNILGTVSFYSGQQYWEVDVNRDGWAVGLAYRSVPRNSWLGSNDASWILHFNPTKMEYKVRHGGIGILVENALVPKQIFIKKIGIYLDFETGKLVFINADVNKKIYTFDVGVFKEPVCAAANPFYHGGSITITTGLDIPEIEGIST